MKAHILSVGTELLLGNIVNTNAAFISTELAKIGVGMYNQTTVGDNRERLTAAIKYAFLEADLIITIGGLGPTLDDITKETAAEYFNEEMELHKESWERIKTRFNNRPMPINVERNALVPTNATIFLNDNGAAPGICLEKDGKIIILLPGPPHELEPMFSSKVVPFLCKKTNGIFFSKTLKIIGVAESKAEDMLKDLIEKQTNPTIAPYAKVGEVHIRITASAENEESASLIIEPIKNEIYKRLSPNIYAEDEITLEERVLTLLKEQNHTLAIAESCTGGLISAGIVDIPGSSLVYKEGLVTYSNEAKIRRLGVKEETLSNFGAVSKETAAEMAEGAAITSGTTVGISTTGVAGPDGGTPEKPVGLVYIGIYIKGKGVETSAFNTTGSRNEIRQRAAKQALDMLRLKLS